MIEADRVQSLGVAPELVNTPSDSGLGQQIARCPTCRVAVWSHYAGSGPITAFVRVGTLDQPDLLPPDVHIFTASKQPWVRLSDDVPAFAEYYDRDTLWPPDSLARREGPAAADPGLPGAPAGGGADGTGQPRTGHRARERQAPDEGLRQTAAGPRAGRGSCPRCP